MTGQSERNILATGSSEVERLRLLPEVYGPHSQVLLRRAGLREGRRRIPSSRAVI